MPAAEHRNNFRAWCALIALIALVMAPNIAWLIIANDFRAFWRPALLMPLGTLVLLFALFARRPWLACLILAPFAALVPAELFYISVYHYPSTARVLASIFATNTGELLAYFDGRLWPLLVGSAACLALALFASRLSRNAGLRWRHPSHRWIVGCSVLLLTALLSVGWFGGRHRSFEDAVAPLQLPMTQLAQGYPFGVASRLAEYLRDRRAMAEGLASLKEYRFDARRIDPQPRRQIHVLVIGESSARNHWQLFGYSRPTTPELAAMDNLVPITDMLSSWPASIYAIPIVVARKPITDQHLGWNEPSIVQAMREAGYDTWWISNQQAMGEFDSPISIYALEAEHTIFLNRTSGTSERSYDEQLLQPLQEVIEKSDRDAFVILHMMGSHQAYDARYPASFTRFTPTFDDATSSASFETRVINSYDNTILYSDHVLAEMMRMLRRSGTIASLWYESDHGETMPTPSCPLSGHGADTRWEFEVPALFWYSDAYAQTFPTRIDILRRNAREKTLTASTFESLLDMAGVEIRDRDPTWSLFSPQWTYHERVVNMMTPTTVGAQVNFDEATFNNACVFPQARREPH